jgi:hypothetical protein
MARLQRFSEVAGANLGRAGEMRGFFAAFSMRQIGELEWRRTTAKANAGVSPLRCASVEMTQFCGKQVNLAD